MSLTDEIDKLREDGFVIEVIPQADGWSFLVFRRFLLPEGFNKTISDLLIKVPPAYPSAKLDMFWTDPDLTLANGGIPQGCSLECALGRQWLRFSWHTNNWNPNYDNLWTFVNFIKMRLRRRA